MKMITKEEAEYVDRALKDWCKDCTMFRKPISCTLVKGDIKRLGHCKYYEAKKGLPIKE